VPVISIGFDIAVKARDSRFCCCHGLVIKNVPTAIITASAVILITRYDRALVNRPALLAVNA
jgi:hypothetical protein